MPIIPLKYFSVANQLRKASLTFSCNGMKNTTTFLIPAQNGWARLGRFAGNSAILVESLKIQSS